MYTLNILSLYSKKINKPKLFNLSKVGNGFDTSSVEIELKNKYC